MICSVAIKATLILNTSYCSMLYLRGSESRLSQCYKKLISSLRRRGLGHSTLTFHDKIIGRVSAAIARAKRHRHEYDQLTVVAHSFGAVIAVDVLVKMQPKSIRLVTLGGPLWVAMVKSKDFNKAVDKLVDEKLVDKWEDFTSKSDWLSTNSPVRMHSSLYHHHSVNLNASLKEKYDGKCHYRYFKHRGIMDFTLCRIGLMYGQRTSINISTLNK